MGKKEKTVLVIIVVIIFLELMKYGLAVKVVAFGFLGYQIYKYWRNR